MDNLIRMIGFLLLGLLCISLMGCWTLQRAAFPKDSEIPINVSFAKLISSGAGPFDGQRVETYAFIVVFDRDTVYAALTEHSAAVLFRPETAVLTNVMIDGDGAIEDMQLQWCKIIGVVSAVVDRDSIFAINRAVVSKPVPKVGK